MVLWALRTVLLWSGLCYGGFVAWQNHDALFALAAPPRPAPAKPVGDAAANTVTFRPDRAGHFLLTAAVNGSPLRFLVDTGASYVTLTPEDARAAGIPASDLRFTGRVATANGEVHVAPVKLREIRLEQFTMEDVDAVVVDTQLSVSLLGMSFLKR